MTLNHHRWSAPTASSTWRSRRAPAVPRAVLDAPDQAGPFEDQRGIDLHQARAGADLGIGVRRAGDAADADDRQLAAGARGRCRAGSRSQVANSGRPRSGRRLRSAKRGSSPAGRAMRGVADDQAVETEASATSAMSWRSASVRSGAIFSSSGGRSRGARARPAPRAISAASASRALQGARGPACSARRR